VLVNNAGLQLVAPLEEFPMPSWELLVQVMLIGVARVTRAVLPGMRTRGFGRIVNMGSIHSLVASPYKSAYVAAKHGLVGFSKTIALETAGVDVTINTICPSYVKTALVDKQIADQARVRGIPEEQVVTEVMLKPMPKGVFIGYDELAGITAFLVSSTTRNVTGRASSSTAVEPRSDRHRRLPRLIHRAQRHRTGHRRRRRLDRAVIETAAPNGDRAVIATPAPP